MRIIRTKDYRDMSRKAANVISAQVILKPTSVLGLATGTTPIGTYEQLAEWNHKGDCDFSQVNTYNLDEYRGLTHEDPQSYHYFMNENFFRKVNIQPDHTHLPDGMVKDLEAEGHRYDALIQQNGGIDLQVLGIGQNAHIGFNEPDVKFEARTHCVALDEETIRANSRFFESPDEVPRDAISMGIKTIMMARRILLLANGTSKAEAVRKAVCGSVRPEAPASILQLHRDVTVILDRAAASHLPTHIEGTKIIHKNNGKNTTFSS